MKKLNAFKKTRVLSGLSQTEAAELLGFTQQYVSYIEKLTDEKIDKYVQKLINALNVEMEVGGEQL